MNLALLKGRPSLKQDRCIAEGQPAVNRKCIADDIAILLINARRVGYFLRVDDFERMHARMVAAGVRFVAAPRVEPYGQVAVFLDIEGNRWDLLGRAIGLAVAES